MIATPAQFELLGRLVTHTGRPRFRVSFSPAGGGPARHSPRALRSASQSRVGDGGAWESDPTEWLDGPPLAGPSSGGLAGETTRQFAARLARLAREAGDFFAAHFRDDWIQAAVIARAGELGLSAYAVSVLTGGAVSPEYVLNYLSRRASMGSHKLQHVLAALGMEIRVRSSP